MWENRVMKRVKKEAKITERKWRRKERKSDELVKKQLAMEIEAREEAWDDKKAVHSRIYLHVGSPELSWLLQEADKPSCYVSLHSTIPGTKGSPMLMAAWSSLPMNFWKQSSLAAQGTTTPPKLTTHCSNQPHRGGAEGSRLLSTPQPGNTCLASRPARRIRWEWTKGTHTQSTHMELRAPVIKPGTSASFSGCLRVQIIRLRPAVPFSLFTLYAPIASATVAFPKSISSGWSPKEEAFLLAYSGEELVRW